MDAMPAPADEDAGARPGGAAPPAGSGDDGSAPGGGKRAGGVKFDDTLSVGVASSTTKTNLLRSIMRSKSGSKSSQGSGGDGPTNVQQLPVPPAARFDSNAQPARPALKSGSSLNLADAEAEAAAAEAAAAAAAAAEEASPSKDSGKGKGKKDKGKKGKKGKVTLDVPPSEADSQEQPRSPGGAAFLAALGGTPANLPPVGAGPTDYGDAKVMAHLGGPALNAPPASAIANPLYDPAGAAGPSGAAAAAAAAAAAGGGRGRVSFDTVALKDASGAGAPGKGDGPARNGDTTLEIDQGSAVAVGAGGQDDVASVAPSSVIVPPGSSEPVPPLRAQLTARALVVGVLVGCAFALLAQRLVLVAGLTPSFQVAMASGCWLVLQAYATIIGRDISCVPPLVGQEVAVASAAALATAGSVVAGGFGGVVEALSSAASDVVGGKPGNAADAVVGYDYGRGVAWLLLVGVAGGLLIVPFRRQLLGRTSMTFPTGEATAGSGGAGGRLPRSRAASPGRGRPQPASGLPLTVRAAAPLATPPPHRRGHRPPDQHAAHAQHELPRAQADEPLRAVVHNLLRHQRLPVGLQQPRVRRLVQVPHVWWVAGSGCGPQQRLQPAASYPR
jgi:hypothetical protein